MMYLIEFEFADRTQLDRTIALTRVDAERRAHRLVDDGTAQFARLIPIRLGRAILIRRSERVAQNGGSK
jgi:hypothetical protein